MRGLTNWVRFLDDEALLTEAPLAEVVSEALLREALLCKELLCAGLFRLEFRKTPSSKTNTIAARRLKAARRPTLLTNLR
jgi:hypothetical protein